jgi:hypothetical protein
MAVVRKVCAGAEKEYTLESALEGMRREWQGVSLTVLPCQIQGTQHDAGGSEDQSSKAAKARARASSYFVLGSAEEILAMLDEQLVKTQTMLGYLHRNPTRFYNNRIQLTL